MLLGLGLGLGLKLGFGFGFGLGTFASCSLLVRAVTSAARCAALLLAAETSRSSPFTFSCNRSALVFSSCAVSSRALTCVCRRVTIPAASSAPCLATADSVWAAASAADDTSACVCTRVFISSLSDNAWVRFCSNCDSRAILSDFMAICSFSSVAT